MKKTSEQWNEWWTSYIDEANQQKIANLILSEDIIPIMMEAAFYAGHTYGLKTAQEIYDSFNSPSTTEIEHPS